ncbi:hypothetical protein [Halopiger goleimassiliensis]|uniref:hypothetical protein n=1 Tax=Halopiger goleimassiliensis TaxID=1293048 RepID=UPI000B19846E|nr:hypothetical protein [Halopiger goleimassiliensis]
MTVRDGIDSRWLRLLCSSIGFVGLLGVVVGLVVVISVAYRVALAALLGGSAAAVIADLSVSVVLSERSDDPLTWLAGLLLLVLLLPAFDRYRAWVGRKLG